MIQAQKYNIKINLWGQEEDELLLELNFWTKQSNSEWSVKTALKYKKKYKSGWFMKLELLELKQCFSQLF